jgi:8-oxo-dGTP diphosphatase
MGFKKPALTADCVIFTEKGLVLIKRDRYPFEGSFALPGGFVEVGETVEQACRREVKEETGLNISNLRLVGVYSEPKRDPRHHTVTVAFLASADSGNFKAGDDAREVSVVRDWQKLKLAFDHNQIAMDALKIFKVQKKKVF